MKHLLAGSFDLHIINTCNLHCKGCVVLDYRQEGIVTNTKYELDDVKVVMKKLQRFDLRLSELKILGGEPTLHKQLNEIIDYIKDTNLVDTLTLVTNGLNFTDKIIKSLRKLDRLVISIYPFEQDLESVLKNSLLYYDLLQDVNIEFWRYETFELYGHQIPEVEYSQRLNWDRCYQKDTCRVVSKEGLYRCTNTYSEKKDLCKWDDKKKIIEFIESDVPLSHCKECPTPALEVDYESNNLPVDIDNFKRGVRLINDYSKI